MKAKAAKDQEQLRKLEKQKRALEQQERELRDLERRMALYGGGAHFMVSCRGLFGFPLQWDLSL